MKIADLFIRLGLKKQEFDSGIDQAKKKTSAFGGAMKKIGGVIAGAFAVGAILNFGRRALSVITGFEQANATLAATLGKNITQISELTKQAKDLGKSTEFTASQVSSLQNELAKLGFSQREIKDSARGILDLASATGNDLANSAKIAGSALRAFNLDASEMDRVTSVLAVSTTKSALSMSDFDTALSTVAPVAKSFGFTIEETVALLGKLKDAGFDASSSATATRNILLNLADSNGKLSKALGGSVKNFDELIPALVKLRNSGVDLNTTLQLTDKRSVAAFNQFLKGAESARELRDSLIDVNEELRLMVQTKTDTVQGALNRVKSAWEGLLITSGGGTDWLKNDLDDWAKLILIWQDNQLSGWNKFWSSISQSGMDKYYDEITQRDEDQRRKDKAFQEIKLSELEKMYDRAVRSYIDAVKAGDKAAEKSFDKQATLIKKRISELSVIPADGGGGAKEITTIDTAILNLQSTIADLQAQVESGQIVDVDEITAAIDKMDEYNKKLLQLQSIRESMNRESAPASIEPISWTDTGVSKNDPTKLDEILFGDMGFKDIDMAKDVANQMDELLRVKQGFNDRAKELNQENIDNQKAWVDELNNVVEAGVENAISSIGSALGEAMATGDWQNFGNQILQVVGGFLQQMGAALIAYGVAMDAFKKAFTNPLAAIAAGSALLIIGGAISGMAKAGPSGGGGAGGYSGASGYSPGSSNAGQVIEGNVTFQLEGNILRGALQNNDRRRGSMR